MPQPQNFLTAKFPDTDCLIGKNEVPLVKQQILAEIFELSEEYAISFYLKPNSFTTGWHSVIHFIIDSVFQNYDYRLPSIWFHTDESRSLFISAPINGSPIKYFKTKPININQWTYIEINQVLNNTFYIYIIKINGELVCSETNYLAQSFNNVKIYASDPWYDAHDGLIKSLFINGISICTQWSDWLSFNVSNGGIFMNRTRSCNVSREIECCSLNNTMLSSIKVLQPATTKATPRTTYLAKSTYTPSAKTTKYLTTQIMSSKILPQTAIKTTPKTTYLAKSTYVPSAKTTKFLTTQIIKTSKILQQTTIKATPKTTQVAKLTYGFSARTTKPLTSQIIKCSEILQQTTIKATPRTTYLAKSTYVVSAKTAKQLSTQMIKTSKILQQTTIKATPKTTYLPKSTYAFSAKTLKPLTTQIIKTSIIKQTTIKATPKLTQLTTSRFTLSTKYLTKQIIQSSKSFTISITNPATMKAISSSIAPNQQYTSIDLLLSINDSSLQDLKNLKNKNCLIGDNIIPLMKAQILVEIPELLKEYVVSFYVKPNSFTTGWHSVIHFTIGSSNLYYVDKVPSIWFHTDGNGSLLISAPINGSPLQYFKTKPIEINQWTYIEISQVLINSFYIYRIKINEEFICAEINNQAQSFKNVRVYASDPWYDAQDGSIKDLLIIGILTPWAQWSDWSSCNVSYGAGFMNRTKKCNVSEALECCSFNNTEVIECFVNETVLLKEVGDLYWNVSNIVTVLGNLVIINLQIYPTFEMVSSVTMEFEYVLPPFFNFISESIIQHFIRTDYNKIKYRFSGKFNSSDLFNYNFTIFFDDTTCQMDGIITLDIVFKLLFQFEYENPMTTTKTFRVGIQCFGFAKIPVVTNKDILKESYGRGIYWDADNSHIYVCMNQHYPSTTVACYYSNNDGYLWADLDIRIGSILGHHNVTKELYAVHRNCKTYMMFHKSLNKWLALTNQQFTDTALNNLDPNLRKNLEDDYDQIYKLGPNQWLGNAEGLFFRKLQNESWIPRVKWRF
ncbi:uncharacterized protein LOC136080612 isoform X2 [Hydra vulgaris]|uniref:Uncharacterized protein LOC136080612 isoform X2 n=1 Tax=Hydra vulgaris TaxID=6087 RepID=A0ABM4BWG3_HYDVU